MTCLHPSYGNQYNHSASHISFLAGNTHNIFWDNYSSHSCTHSDLQIEQTQLFYVFYFYNLDNHKTIRKFRQLWSIHSIWPRSCFWRIHSAVCVVGWFYRAGCKFYLLLSKSMLTDKNRVDSSQTIFRTAAIMIKHIIRCKLLQLRVALTLLLLSIPTLRTSIHQNYYAPSPLQIKPTAPPRNIKTKPSNLISKINWKLKLHFGTSSQLIRLI